MKPLPCIICGKQLEEVIPGTINQPYQGTAFESRGHYGSTVWDPAFSSSDYLSIVICDECLKQAAEKKLVLHIHPHSQQVDYDAKPWDPSEDD